MKRLLLISAMLVCIILISSAQAPQKFNYQAVARDNTGAEIKNQSISVRMSIRSGSTSGVNEYVETFTASTNEFGLFAVEVGGGTPVLGSMSNIDWGNKSHFLAVVVDFSGGSNYQLMSITQLVSVPYALYAEKSGDSNDGDTNSTNELQVLSKTGNTVYLSKSGGSFIDEVNYDDADSLNELQNLSIVGHDLTISKGNTVTIPDNVDDADADSTNEIQTLSRSNDTIYLSNGGFIKISKVPDPVTPVPIQFQGKIIYVHPTNNSSSIEWGGFGTTTNAISTTDGEANTSTITTILGAGNYAAKMCNNLVAFGYSDWYLPSLYELEAIYKQSYLLKGFEYSFEYWSSTELNNNVAWTYKMYNGTVSTINKSNTVYCRCVRKD